MSSFLPDLLGSTGPSSLQSTYTDSLHRLTAENISQAPPTAHAAPQSSAPTTVSASVAGHGFLVTPPLQIGPSYDTSVAGEMPPTTHLNRPQSSGFRPDPKFLLSATQYQEHYPVHRSLQPECDNWTLPQAQHSHINTSIVTHHRAQPYTAPSVNQYYSIYSQHHSLYPDHPPTFRYPQVGNILQPGTLYGQRCSTSQPSLPPQAQQSSNQRLSRFLRKGQSFFDHARDFVINDSVFVQNSSDNFMASLLELTIQGAEYDSSDHNMPLRCHPGTRSEIIKRCQDFILNRDDRSKLRWVVGAAGVGKSAIMQSVAHDESNVLSDIIVGATIFFSINGRQDGSKAITTIAYQLAVKLYSYHLFVQREITRDPSLLRKSLSKQFDKFIVEPFVHQRILDSYSRLLIIIDGLDECANSSTQLELLNLISFFCITYPSSPIVWMVASRPEPHITSFFAQPKVALAYEMEEISIDTDEARNDVIRYLSDKLREVQLASITLRELAQWPSEVDLLKIATASGGLFAYASTVVRYIGDLDYGDPVSMLDDVLEIISTGTKANIWGRNHPMAQLDALYSHIMSKVPASVIGNTRKLLLLCLDEAWYFLPFRLQCNMLGMTQNAAYGATHHIRSVAYVPGPAKAGQDSLNFFHKSFSDYLRDFERSGFSSNIGSDVEQVVRPQALRILEEAPEGVYVNDASDNGLGLGGGVLKNGPGTGENVFVSWPALWESDNRQLRLSMFRQTVWAVVSWLRRGESVFQSLACIRVLTTCFAKLPEAFPFGAVQDFMFDESRRRMLLEHGILKQVSLGTLDYDAITIRHCVRLHFRGPTVEHSNRWNASCRHEREGSWEGSRQDWSTHLTRTRQCNPRYRCEYCFERFTRHFTAQEPAHGVTVLGLTPTLHWVELRLVDPDDGVSEWIYHFFTGRDDQYGYYDEYDDDDDDDDDEDGEDIDGGGRDHNGED